MAPRQPILPTSPVEPAIIAPGGPHSTSDIKILSSEEEPLQQALSGLQKAATWVFWIALTVGSTLFLTLVLDMRKGSQSKLPYNPNAENVTAYFNLLSTSLTLALIVFAVSFLLLTWEEKVAGGIVSAAGVGIHLFFPWVIFGLFGRTAATATMAQGFRHVGFVLAMLGAAKLVWDTYLTLKALPARMQKSANVGVPGAVAEQEGAASRANVFSPCWQLSFCREVVRRECPAYLAKTKCWKFGKGCFCDEEMINHIITGGHASLQEKRNLPHPVARRAGKPPCRRCYIFLEHQGLKLQWLSPLALPLAVGLTGIIWPLYNLIWKAFGGVFDWLWKQVAFVPVAPIGPQPRSGAPAGQLDPDQVAALAQNLIGICLGFILLIVVLRIIEFAVDRWGW